MIHLPSAALGVTHGGEDPTGSVKTSRAANRQTSLHLVNITLPPRLGHLAFEKTLADIREEQTHVGLVYSTLKKCGTVESVGEDFHPSFPDGGSFNSNHD